MYSILTVHQAKGFFSSNPHRSIDRSLDMGPHLCPGNQVYVQLQKRRPLKGTAVGTCLKNGQAQQKIILIKT